MRQLLLLTSCLIFLTACGRLTEYNNPAPAPPPATSTPIPSNNTGGAVAPPTTSFADVVARVAPAVVTIHSARRARAARQHPFFDDPRFREFFGLPRSPQQDAP